MNVKRVYKVRYVLAEDSSVHTTYLYADDVQEALDKLAHRFSSEPREIYIESIHEDHGQFVIGADEMEFPHAGA